MQVINLYFAADWIEAMKKIMRSVVSPSVSNPLDIYSILMDGRAVGNELPRFTL